MILSIKRQRREGEWKLDLNSLLSFKGDCFVKSVCWVIWVQKRVKLREEEFKEVNYLDKENSKKHAKQ